MRVQFPEYLPDQAPFLTESLVAADGCVPIANGYAPFKQFVGFPNGALPQAAIGATAYRYNQETFLLAATPVALYRYYASGWQRLRYGLGGSTFTRFQQFGRYMLVTNGANPIYRFDPTNPTVLPVVSTDAPTARFLGEVQGFAVAGYADGSSLRVRWSDAGDATNWTPGGASLAGLFDMPSGGNITGLTGGEYGLILQEQRVVRMSYTADPDNPWQFDEISSNIGCIAAGSVAKWGALTFFLSPKGFMVCDGTSVTPIGDEKVDRTYLAQSELVYYDNITAAIDPINSLYVVSVPNAAPNSGVFIYNYVLNRWSTAPVTAEVLFQGFTQATSLDDLDSIYGSLDAIPVSLDSPSFRGGNPLLMAFSSAHALGSFAGPPLDARITDCFREPNMDARSRMTAVRPLGDAPSLVLTVSGKMALADTPSSTDYTTRQSAGLYRVREQWNYYQIGLGIPAGTPWTYAQGYDAAVIGAGRP